MASQTSDFRPHHQLLALIASASGLKRGGGFYNRPWVSPHTAFYKTVGHWELSRPIIEFLTTLNLIRSRLPSAWSSSKQATNKQFKQQIRSAWMCPNAFLAPFAASHFSGLQFLFCSYEFEPLFVDRNDLAKEVTGFPTLKLFLHWHCLLRLVEP